MIRFATLIGISIANWRFGMALFGAYSSGVFSVLLRLSELSPFLCRSHTTFSSKGGGETISILKIKKFSVERVRS
jgi:hypothetical protein